MRAPKTLDAALADDDADDWELAMDEHLAFLDERHVWEWVAEVPEHAAVHPSAWTFAYECDAAGDVVEYIARVEVVAGDTGCSGAKTPGAGDKGGRREDAGGGEDEDDSEVEARADPGLGLESANVPPEVFRTLRVLLAIATAEKQQLCHVRLPRAHLSHELAQAVYIAPPPFSNGSGRVGAYRLLRPLPGLRIAATAAAEHIAEGLEDMGFRALDADANVFVRNADQDHPTAILRYGADLLIMAPSTLQLADVLVDLELWHGKADVENCGFPRTFLGCKVEHNHPTRQVWLSQPGLLADLWPAYPELDSLPATYSPPEPTAYTSLTRERYTQLVACLAHIAGTTRPDLSLWVSALQEAAEAGEPSHHDRASALTLLAHLGKTLSFALAFGGAHDQAPEHPDDEPLAVYVHAGALMPACWQYGYVVRVAGSTVAWASRRCTVANELRHAEVIGQCEAVREAEQVQALVRELGYARLAPAAIPVRAGRTRAGPQSDELPASPTATAREMANGSTTSPSTSTDDKDTDVMIVSENPPSPSQSPCTYDRRPDPEQVDRTTTYISAQTRTHALSFPAAERYRMGSTSAALQYAEYLGRLVDKGSDVDNAQFNYWVMQLGVVEVKPEGCNLRRILDGIKGMQLI